ncbi:MAG: calcium-translocating P-type ATPase, SERCA-type [Nanoarchaeota archaeon]
MSFHDTTAKEVLRELTATEGGLTTFEADRRRGRYGPNTLTDSTRTSVLTLILEQFASPIVWILLFAMGISLFVKEYADFYVIAIIVVLNAILGFAQEYRAEKAIALLQKLTALKAKVIRDGREILLDAAELVPGDIVLLETGDKVPADCRILTATNLQTQEANLTGESTPVQKNTLPSSAGALISEKTCMLFASTIIVAGRAKAIVATTGNLTEIGKIAKLIKTAKTEDTPLQKKLAELSFWLTLIVIVVAACVFTLGALQGKPLLTFFIAALALAVAAIPEGLPAVVTIALALGVQRMASRNALVRKLPSAETLGACTVICTDKTGTLTKNQMTVTKLFVDNQVVDVTGTGYQTTGRFSSQPKDLDLLLTIGAINNNATLKDSVVLGDPTEGALLVSAIKAGLSIEKLSTMYPRIREIEFTSERKIMTTIHQKAAFIKGAPDVLLKKCTHILLNGKTVTMLNTERTLIANQVKQFGQQALRVLAFATTKNTKTPEQSLTFVGLQAMIDPPRAEAREAIRECHNAGIKVIMITGDHADTADAIADSLGIPGRVVTGAELDLYNLDNISDIGVFARVNPEHKIRIVHALQAAGHVVAMTGDGINDAPALKKADIGIAMGSGTDVAKDASAMILADDNFASIVAAIREGRRIYDNIGKSVRYLLAANAGEVITVFTALLLALPLPFLAIQLLWINLVTDGMPALALSVEPAGQDIMRKKPQRTPIIGTNNIAGLLIIGTTMMLGTLLLFVNAPVERAQTIAFTAIVMMQLCSVLSRRTDRSVFVTNPFSNIWVLLALATSLALQLSVLYIPALNTLFKTVPLTGIEWAWIMSAAISVLLVGELLKLRKSTDATA